MIETDDDPKGVDRKTPLEGGRVTLTLGRSGLSPEEAAEKAIEELGY